MQKSEKINRFVTYINTLNDSPNSPTSLLLEKEYEITGQFSWVDENDCWMIQNEKGSTTFYLKKRFSEPYTK